MPRLEFVTLDVFTRERYAGNPLAVVRVPEGIDVPTEVMQKIAREFNLSETIFIHDAKKGADGLPEWRVRIFLTVAEIPFAGHPTIGAAVYALGDLAASSSNEEPSSDSRSIVRGRFLANAGPMDLTFNPATGLANANIAHNFHEHVQNPFTVEEHIAVVSPVKGMNFVSVELPDLDALAAVSTSSKPAPRLDEEWNVGFCGSYFYVYTSSSLPHTTKSSDDADDADGIDELIEIQSRMIEGLMEDPATGSAGCGLACYVALKRGRSRVTSFKILQGVEMGRRSEIEVVVTLTEDLKGVEGVRLGGTAVRVMEGWVGY
ncbi:hypothetical protein CERZMDRAFT_38938 [Cercospora zeae-maydis SCOH1-5]|uniref:Phenazine biosynthesis protein n=1 Tax=Cercospora zeae-maydis SCOH1-5 TaxID=717836 RepID=A0A6A6FIV4_9PEZI|nr:hypothetical protein CERZMDRAFT_38938 [Cercospora zeae-maydis SCOH1-5]